MHTNCELGPTVVVGGGGLTVVVGVCVSYCNSRGCLTVVVGGGCLTVVLLIG